MEDKKIAKGLSVAAIILITISAVLLSLNKLNGRLYGTEATFYGIPFVAAFAIPLLAILILLTRYLKSTDTMDDMIAAVAVRYAIFGWFFVFAIRLGNDLLNMFCYDFYQEHYTTIYLLMNSFNVCVIGTLVLGFLLRDIPAVKIEKKKMKAGQLFLIIMMMYGLTHIGSLMGTPIDTAISLFSSTDPAEASKSISLMFGSDLFIRILCIGILPAIFEELLFRKFLIDRTLRYGEFISCAMSGIMFGLWHGNFQQFFFTFFIGVLASFVYIRTGKIIYTMIMHASLNLVTSTVTMQMLQEIMKKAGFDMTTGKVADMSAVEAEQMLRSILPLLCFMLAWLLILVSFQIAGFIILIVKRKMFKLVAMEGEPARKVILRKLTHNVSMWVFFAFALLLFFTAYMPGILAKLFG